MAQDLAQWQAEGNTLEHREGVAFNPDCCVCPAGGLGEVWKH